MRSHFALWLCRAGLEPARHETAVAIEHVVGELVLDVKQVVDLDNRVGERPGYKAMILGTEYIPLLQRGGRPQCKAHHLCAQVFWQFVAGRWMTGVVVEDRQEQARRVAQGYRAVHSEPAMVGPTNRSVSLDLGTTSAREL